MKSLDICPNSSLKLEKGRTNSIQRRHYLSDSTESPASLQRNGLDLGAISIIINTDKAPKCWDSQKICSLARIQTLQRYVSEWKGCSGVRRRYKAYPLRWAIWAAQSKNSKHMEETARNNWHQIGFTDQRDAVRGGQPFFKRTSASQLSSTSRRMCQELTISQLHG